MKSSSYKASKVAFLSVALACAAVCIECGWAEEPLTYSEVVKETARKIDLGMELYAGPPITSQPEAEPQSLEMVKWSSEDRTARLGALEEMDRAVIDMLLKGFESGMSMNSIRLRTESCVSWVEWPKQYDNRQGEPKGIFDRSLTEEEWASPANAVVVIHQAYESTDGVVYHFLQTTFRNRRGKDVGMRPSFSAYVVMLDQGAVRLDRLYWTLDSDADVLSVSSAGYPPKLLGFVEQNENGVPGILMYKGVYGTAHIIDIYYYPWVEPLDRWEEFYLGARSPASYLEFDPKTTELRCYGNIDFLDSIWNLSAALASGEHGVEESIQKKIEEEALKSANPVP